MEEHEKKIMELEAAIADLKQRLPAHSVQPQLILELEELEETLEIARAQRTVK